MILDILFYVLVLFPFSIGWVGVFWIGKHLPAWLDKKPKEKEND